MKKIIFFILSFLFSFNFCLSEIEEYFDADFINSDYMNLCITSDNRIFLCGYIGAILCSYDLGLTWNKFIIEPKGYLMSIDAIENTIISVGFDGYIIYSNDRGVTWLKPDSITNQSLKAVVLINSQTGVALGNSGTIIKTTNGGANWVSIQSQITGNIYSAILSENNSILITTSEQKIYKSTDIGETWKPLNIPDDNYSIFSSFSKSLDNYFYLMADSNLLKLSNDGETFQSFKKPSVKSINCFYKKEGKGFHIGDQLLLKIISVNDETSVKDTTDLGIAIKPSQATYLRKIAFLNDNDGIAIGSKNFIARTSDGGKNWSIISYLNSFIYDPTHVTSFGGFFFLSDSTGYVGADYENVFKTTNYGNTWEYLPKDTNRGNSAKILQIHCYDENKMLLHSEANGGVTILKTINGLKTVIRDTIRALNGASPNFFHIEDDDFFITGTRWFYNTFHSYSGFMNFDGKTWNTSVIDSAYLGKPTFSSKSGIYQCGSFVDSSLLPLKPDIYYRGLVVHSLDTGKTWEKYIFDSLAIIKEIKFINDNLGFVFGNKLYSGNDDSDIVYKTTNDGKSWNYTDTNIIRLTTQLKPPNDRFCFGNNKGKEVFSIDWGQNWEDWNYPSNLYIEKIITTKKYAYMPGKIGDSYSFIYRYKLKDEYISVDETQSLPAPLAYMSVPYPNPANEYTNFDIVWDKRFDLNELNFSISNIFGQKVEKPKLELYGKTINTATIRWNTGSVPRGLYIFQLEVDGYQRAHKVIVY